MPEVLSSDAVDERAATELNGWSREGDTLVRAVESDTFALGIRLVDAVAVVADEVDHHPDIDIRWTTVTFRLSTHSAGGITDNDIALAKRIDALADQR
jgi:4a-hydroxytetrahydrobiopterin dehydratase